MNPCTAGRRCADYNPRTQQAALTEGNLCPDCTRVGERATNQLTLDYRDLAQHIAPSGAQRLDGQPAGSFGHPMPIRGDIEALQRAIWWVTTTWAEILADQHHLAGLSKRTRDGWAVQWACGILAPRMNQLANLGPQQLADYPLTDLDDAIRYRSIALVTVTGAQAVLDLTWLHRRSAAMLGLTRLVRDLPGYCPQCQRADLHQDNGSDTVYCATCAHTETRDDYERRVDLLGART